MIRGPHTGAHLVPVDALSRFDVPVDPVGVLLGRTRERAAVPVSVQLFRAAPTQIVLVTAAYVARLLALRAQATGALVQVATHRPDGWRPLVAAGARGRTVVEAPDAPLPTHATPGSPLLRCDDVGPGGASLRGDLGAWQARAVIQDLIPPRALPALPTFDLAIMQRVAPDVAHPVQVAFGLPPEVADWLPQLPDDVVAVLTPGRARIVGLSPTRVERDLLGAPVRRDG